jgi:hydroxymethylglutaryl-CoA lyase
MKQLFITDVSPRDGLQNQAVHLSTQDKCWLVEALSDSGIPRIEATSFVSPTAVPQMADAADLLAAVSGSAKDKLCVLVPNSKGFLRAYAAGAREICVVISATETMNQRNIRMSLEQAMSTCLDVVAQAQEVGLQTRAYVAVAFACPFEGQTSPELVLYLSKKMADAGADEVVVVLRRWIDEFKMGPVFVKLSLGQDARTNEQLKRPVDRGQSDGVVDAPGLFRDGLGIHVGTKV